MISYQESTKFWQRSWFAALIGGLAVGVGVWWWQANQDAQEATEAAASAGSAPVSVAAQVPVLASTPGNVSEPSVLADGRPPDFTPEDWAALTAAMSNQPNAKAEMERVVTYLRFQRSFEQWQALADSRDVAKRHRLAESLLTQLPDRLAKAEVTMGEALLLSTALVTDLESNERLREQRLALMRGTLERSVPKPDQEQAARDADLMAEFRRRESAIVAAYQALPEAKRDQTALARDLDAARQAVYGNAKH